MKRFLREFLGPEAKQSIDSMHYMQKIKYGVYAPPSLKQLVSLRHLLINTANFNDVKSEELLGLSKIECHMLLKKLNQMYNSQRRYRRLSSTGDEMQYVKTASS